MYKLLVIGLASSLVLLGGCASSLSGSAYERRQARTAHDVQMGVVEHVRVVQIEGTKSGIGSGAGAVIGATAGSNAGANHGSAVERSGDYFGTTINIAARVSALAAGGEVLVTGQTAALAPDLEGVLYESRGRQVLRNVAEPVEIFAVVRVDENTDHLAIDPSARWRSIQSTRSVACCWTRRRTTSVRLVARQPLPSTRSGTRNSDVALRDGEPRLLIRRRARAGTREPPRPAPAPRSGAAATRASARSKSVPRSVRENGLDWGLEPVGVGLPCR